MPRARLMLNSPAASAAPVPPAHTSAWARPAATALAAWTIDASGVDRAARTGSALFAIDTGASMTSTSGGISPSSPAGPNSSTLAPASAASAAPAATSAGPRSAPLQSTATTGSRIPARWPGEEDESPGANALGVVVIVAVIVRRRRHDLTAGVEATHRTDTVGSPRAVALRARVHRGREDLVLRPALSRAAVRLLFLGDGHRSQKASTATRPGGGEAVAAPCSHSSFSSLSFAQRESGGRS